MLIQKNELKKKSNEKKNGVVGEQIKQIQNVVVRLVVNNKNSAWTESFVRQETVSELKTNCSPTFIIVRNEMKKK